MGRFVYGPGAFVGTLLVGLAAVAAVGYLMIAPTVDYYLAGRECIEARDDAGADELVDEWTVYEAFFKEEGLDKSHTLIIDNSSSLGSSMNITPVAPGVSSAANNNYWEKNLPEHSLSCLFASKGASFITRAEIESLSEDHFWTVLRRSHPGASGILSLSRVGFDHDRKEAVVSFSFSCGDLCGHGGAWKFTKIDGKWSKAGTSGIEFVS